MLCSTSDKVEYSFNSVFNSIPPDWTLGSVEALGQQTFIKLLVLEIQSLVWVVEIPSQIPRSASSDETLKNNWGRSEMDVTIERSARVLHPRKVIYCCINYFLEYLMLHWRTSRPSWWRELFFKNFGHWRQKNLKMIFFSIERIGNKKFNFRICISDGTPQLMELESNFTKLDFEGNPDTQS